MVDDGILHVCLIDPLGESRRPRLIGGSGESWGREGVTGFASSLFKSLI